MLLLKADYGFIMHCVELNKFFRPPRYLLSSLQMCNACLGRYCPRNPKREIAGLHAKPSLLVLDGHFRPGGLLILAADKIRDLLILGLLGGALVALVSLAEDMLLDPIDAC